MDSQVMEGEEVSRIVPSNAGSANIILGTEEDLSGEDDPFKACVLSRNYNVAPHTVTSTTQITTTPREEPKFARPDMRSIVYSDCSAPRYEAYSVPRQNTPEHQASRDSNDNRKETFRQESRRSSPSTRSSCQ